MTQRVYKSSMKQRVYKSSMTQRVYKSSMIHEWPGHSLITSRHRHQMYLFILTVNG